MNKNQDTSLKSSLTKFISFKMVEIVCFLTVTVTVTTTALTVITASGVLIEFQST